MKKNRIIIAGSRTVPEQDYDLFMKCLKIFKNFKRDEVEIVSGTARGADKFGENTAETWGLPIKKFPPDWSLGKKAGYLRNKQMAEYATHLIAIVDLAFESRGTRLMIDLAKEYGLKIRVLYINEDKAKFSKISLA